MEKLCPPPLENTIGRWIDLALEPIEPKRMRFLWAWLSTASFYFLANGYSFFNFYPVHDALVYASGYYAYDQISHGRFLIPIYRKIIALLPVPFLTGMLSMLYLGMAVYFVTEILRQKGRLGIVLTSAFLSANLATVELNAVHQYCTDSLMLALLFACIGAYCLFESIDIKSSLTACIMFIFSFGLYPAFITFAGCLLVFAAAMEIAANNKISVRKILIWAAVIIISAVIYFVSSKMVIYLLNVVFQKNVSEATSNWSIYTIGKHSLSTFSETVAKNYKCFFEVLFSRNAAAGAASGIATTLMVITCTITFVRIYWENTKKWVFCIIACLLVLFPLGSRLVNIFTTSLYAARTMYAQSLVYPFAVTLMILGLNHIETVDSACINKRKIRHFGTALLIVLSVVVVWSNISFSNEAFMKQRINSERALYHTGRVLQDLDDYYPNRDDSELISVVGRFRTEGSIKAENPDFEGGLNQGNGITYDLTFIGQAGILGYSLSMDDTEAIKEMQEVKEMPSYPCTGYIKEINNTIVIKLSD